MSSNLHSLHWQSVFRLIANITRCFFWLGKHFEFALLLQSILMILAQVCTNVYAFSPEKTDQSVTQLVLLYICILYTPRLGPENLGNSTRPLSFWQWHNYSQYIEFLAGFMLVFSCSAKNINVLICTFSVFAPPLCSWFLAAQNFTPRH